MTYERFYQESMKQSIEKHDEFMGYACHMCHGVNNNYHLDQMIERLDDLHPSAVNTFGYIYVCLCAEHRNVLKTCPDKEMLDVCTRIIKAVYYGDPRYLCLK